MTDKTDYTIYLSEFNTKYWSPYEKKKKNGYVKIQFIEFIPGTSTTFLQKLLCYMIYFIRIKRKTDSMKIRAKRFKMLQKSIMVPCAIYELSDIIYSHQITYNLINFICYIFFKYFSILIEKQQWINHTNQNLTSLV